MREGFVNRIEFLSKPLTPTEAGAIGRLLTYEDLPFEKQIKLIWQLVDSIILLTPESRR